MSTISSRDTVERSREFWRRALLAGAFTALPRWTCQPMAGVSEYEARISDELVATLRRLADDLSVPLSSVGRTAHAKVLSALWGERDVSIGYAAEEDRSPLLCRLTTKPHSWRTMLLETPRAVLELLSHADFPVDDLTRELGLTKPLFETVFDPTGDERGYVRMRGGALAEGIVLWVDVVCPDALMLRLRPSTDAIHPDS